MKLVTHKRRRKTTAEVVDDVNLRAAALLYDMAALQPTERSSFGYKRAAKAVVGLPMSIVDVVAAGTLREIPFIGPSSARVISEFIETGTSPTVDAAIAKSAKGALVTERRLLRENFLSHFVLQQALAGPDGAGIVRRADYRGDFQMHSTWSDGGEGLEAMADACMRLGHTCLGITDHSYGLPIARGMSMTSVTKQHQEIDTLNAKFEGRFRIFKGIEANILTDGSLDLQPDERGLFEFVVASPHSQLRRADDQTSRMLAAVRGKGVAMLGHPRGRMFDKRTGVIADWDKVFQEAAKRHVAIELDGNWHRQDIDYVLARRALEAGCIFALDSDAHSIGELRFSEYAIAHARLAGIPASKVINCWSDDALTEWMREHRRPRS